VLSAAFGISVASGISALSAWAACFRWRRLAYGLQSTRRGEERQRGRDCVHERVRACERERERERERRQRERENESNTSRQAHHEP